MHRSTQQLRDDALAIWQAGVDAVRSDRLIRDNVCVEGRILVVGDERLNLDRIRRIAVVGAGKAGAGMADGLEQVFGEQLAKEKDLQGWLNVPADCVRQLRRITLHAARPAGVNEPTAEGVAGTERILQLVETLGPDDLCLCLLSGGGSALLPAPVPGVTLEDKRTVTRFLSAAGANIQELNTVRKQLSRIKGGGLARACRAGRLISLIISDVLGDPLEIIASGPTVPPGSTPRDALAILDRFAARAAGVPAALFDYLQRADNAAASAPFPCDVTNVVIGNNAVAVDAAGVEAERRGYSHAMLAARELEGAAENVGRHLARMARRMRTESGPDCLITGGEPTVKLADAAIRGRGGRNQQLVLAAFDELYSLADSTTNPLDGIALLSGGTDGEDGPTDAAGAIADADSVRDPARQREAIADHLQRNDAYNFFGPLDGLIKTGPTHTNVCDVRVVVVSQPDVP